MLAHGSPRSIVLAYRNITPKIRLFNLASHGPQPRLAISVSHFRGFVMHSFRPRTLFVVFSLPKRHRSSLYCRGGWAKMSLVPSVLVGPLGHPAPTCPWPGDLETRCEVLPLSRCSDSFVSVVFFLCLGPNGGHSHRAGRRPAKGSRRT